MSGGPRAICRLRSRRRLVLAGLVLTTLVILDQRGWLLVSSATDLDYHGRQCHVVRVIDGDTVDLDLPDQIQHTPVTRLRLWGIDCPEEAHADRPAEPGASQATALARSLVGTAEITVLVEKHQTRDRYGRLLAYIELPDGTDLGEALLSRGLAVADDRWPHRRLRRYDQLENAARRRAVGIWAESGQP